MGIIFMNESNIGERTKFFVKKVSFRKKRTIDEQNGLFREMKKISFFKNERKKIQKRMMFYRSNELEKTIVFLRNKRIFQKYRDKTIVLF